MISNIKRKAYNLLSYAFPLNLSSDNESPKAKEKIINSDGLEIKMVVSTPFKHWQAKTFFIKKPGTIDWIKTLMAKGAVFYDVGACVGVYSLFVASFFKKNKETNV